MNDASASGTPNRRSSREGNLPSRDDIVREVTAIRVGHGTGAEGREHELRRFRQTLLNRHGQFALFFAVGNDRVLQRQLTRELFANVSNMTPVELELTGLEDSVIAALERARDAPNPLVVYGIDRLLPSSSEGRERRERTLIELQHRRELFRTLARPVVLWMPEYVFAMLGQEAVDFWSWRTGSFFFPEQTTPDVSELGRAALFPPIENTVLDFPGFQAVGREREISAVVDALEAGSHAILVGTGGVGKTTVARHVMRIASHSFPDGAIYVSLEDRAGEGDVAATGLREIIRTLAPVSDFSDNAVKLYALYRDLLAGRQALVVIDDVPDEKVARLFLPPPKCQLVVTSRNNLSLPGATVIPIGALDQAESVHMLKTLVPEVAAEEAELLAQWCNGEPLALRLVAGLLKVDTAIRPTDLVGILQSAGSDRGEQRESSTATFRLLEVLLKRLAPSEMRVLRVLTVFPDDFTRDAANAVYDEDIETELVRLQTYGLVAEERPNRIRLPALVRTYVRDRTDISELEPGEHRHSQYFAALLETADRTYHRPGAASPEEGLRLFETEWTNIRHGQNWAASRAEVDEDAATLCLWYAVAAPNLARARLSAQMRIEWIEVALNVARRRRAAELVGMLLLDAAEGYRTLGALNRAADYEWEAGVWYTRLVEQATERGDVRAQAHAYNALATRALDHGDLTTATDRYTTLLRVAREVAEPTIEAYALEMLGKIAQRRGDLSEAKMRFNNALAILETSDSSPALRAQCLSELCAVAYERGAWDEAEHWAKRALEVQESLQDRPAISALFHRLGAIARRRGDLKDAERWLRQALDLQETLGNRRAAAALYHDLGDVLSRRTDLSGAEHLLQRALREDEQLGNLQGVAVAAFQLGQLALRMRQLYGAEQWLRRATETAERVGDRQLSVRSTLLLGDVSKMRGDFERAAEAYRAALNDSRAINDLRTADVILFRLANLLTQWGRIEEGIYANLESLRETSQLGRRGDPQPNLRLLVKQQNLLGSDRFKQLLQEQLGNELANQLMNEVDNYHETPGD